MKRLGEEIRDELGGLESITLTALKAVRPYEIAIEVPEATLREYGLTFDQVVRAVRNHSVDLSAEASRPTEATFFYAPPSKPTRKPSSLSASPDNFRWNAYHPSGHSDRSRWIR